MKRTLKKDFLHELLEKERAKFTAFTAELRIARILERELNAKAKKCSHFEINNVVSKENKFTLLVQT